MSARKNRRRAARHRHDPAALHQIRATAAHPHDPPAESRLHAAIAHPIAFVVAVILSACGGVLIVIGIHGLREVSAFTTAGVCMPNAPGSGCLQLGDAKVLSVSKPPSVGQAPGYAATAHGHEVALDIGGRGLTVLVPDGQPRNITDLQVSQVVTAQYWNGELVALVDKGTNARWITGSAPTNEAALLALGVPIALLGAWILAWSFTIRRRRVTPRPRSGRGAENLESRV